MGSQPQLGGWVVKTYKITYEKYCNIWKTPLKNATSYILHSLNGNV